MVDVGRARRLSRRIATVVASAIVGARTATQLRASLGAQDLVLPDELRKALDEVSAPDLGYPGRF